jgi:hypothetical protein
MKFFLTTIGILFFGVTQAVQAETPDLTRFSKIYDLQVTGIVTPKVIRFQTTDYLGRFGVLQDEDGEIVPHRIIHRSEKLKKQKLTIAVHTNTAFEGSPQYLVDGKMDTEFTFVPEKNATSKVLLEFPELTLVSGILMHLADGVIPPKQVSIQGKFSMESEIFTPIINNFRFSTRVPFPTVKVKALELSFATSHFFRVSEIEILEPSKIEIEEKEDLIFFAKEGASYRFYAQPVFGQKSYATSHYQPLSVDTKTPSFSLSKVTLNPDFDNDFDDDGISDEIDLCPQVKDKTNQDVDQNGRGDVCEDPDQDRVFSHQDNCPFVYNPRQLDIDQDSEGDACDEEENRLTEQSDFWVLGGFGVAVLVLLWLMWRSLKKA